MDLKGKAYGFYQKDTLRRSFLRVDPLVLRFRALTSTGFFEGSGFRRLMQPKSRQVCQAFMDKYCLCLPYF